MFKLHMFKCQHGGVPDRYVGNIKVIRGHKCDLKHLKTSIWMAYLEESWRLSPVWPVLSALLSDFSAQTFSKGRRILSCPPVCTSARGSSQFLRLSEILTSIPLTRSVCTAVTHFYSRCFSSFLFPAFAFWFIHQSDLKSRSFPWRGTEMVSTLPMQTRILLRSQAICSILFFSFCLLRLLAAKQQASPPPLLPPGEPPGVPKQFLSHVLGLPHRYQPFVPPRTRAETRRHNQNSVFTFWNLFLNEIKLVFTWLQLYVRLHDTSVFDWLQSCCFWVLKDVDTVVCSLLNLRHIYSDYEVIDVPVLHPDVHSSTEKT